MSAHASRTCRRSTVPPVRAVVADRRDRPGVVEPPRPVRLDPGVHALGDLVEGGRLPGLSCIAPVLSTDPSDVVIGRSRRIRVVSLAASWSTAARRRGGRGASAS